MDFTKTDVTILLTMSLAIISMSFVFPALGLTNADATEENQIPEFDIDSDRFDFVGELPDRPRSTDSGVIVYRADGYDNRDVDLYVDGGDLIVGTSAFVSDNGESPPVEVTLNEFPADGSGGGAIDTANATLNETGDRAELTVEEETEYTVRYELIELDEEGTGDFEAQVQFEVIESPGGGGFLGTIFGAADTLASTVAWIGTVFYWLSVSTIETILNLIAIIVSVMTFGIDLVSFLVSEYTSIISASTNFASVFVAIPGILLSVVLAKLVFIGISLLPTT